MKLTIGRLMRVEIRIGGLTTKRGQLQNTWRRGPEADVGETGYNKRQRVRLTQDRGMPGGIMLAAYVSEGV